ncbi:hypothetical protein EG829_13690 [bacterium]|nr:hypothetical protein [bacterium]
MDRFGMGGTPASSLSAGERFEKPAAELMRAWGHEDRGEPVRFDCGGPLMPCERRSVEPISARLVPGDIRSTHQRMHRLVAESLWSDRRTLTAVGHTPCRCTKSARACGPRS